MFAMSQTASWARPRVPEKLNSNRTKAQSSRRTTTTCQQLTLLVGNKNYSSWSLRPWLYLKANGIPFEEKQFLLYQPETRDNILQAGSPTGKVPALLEDGKVIAWDSLSIIEYLAERYPETRGWPTDRKDRARARSLAAEMHSGFMGVRTEFPMSVKRNRPRATWPSHVEGEIERIQSVWATQRRRAVPGSGPFLFGPFGAVDCMFAPVVLRFKSYKIPVEDQEVQAYMDAVLSLPAMKAWVEAALRETAVIASSDNVD